MALHLLFMGLYAFLSGTLSPEDMFYMSAFQCALSLFLSLNSGKAVISPINVTIFATLIVSLANVRLIGQLGNLDNHMYAYLIPEHLGEAALMWGVGSSALFLGYGLINKKGLPSLRYDLKIDDMDRYFYVIIFIAVTAPYLSGVVHALGSSIGKLIFLAGQIGILVFARLWAVNGERKFLTYALLLYAYQTYHALTFSFLRFELVFPTIIFMIGYIAGKKTYKAIFNIQVLPLFVVGFIFFNLFGKLGANRANFSEVVYQEYIADHEELAAFSGAQDVDNSNSSALLDRSSCVAQITCAVELVKKRGYLNGEASQPILLALIPRFLWPDKPKIALGQWYALQIGAATLVDGRVNNSINMTAPAELYIDFGYLGVIFGCMFYGMFIALIWNGLGFYDSELNILGVLYGGYMLVLALNTLVGDMQVVILHISTYGSIFIIKKLLPKQKLPEEPVPAI